MKRFLVTILALLYFAVSSGVAISVHYCMGKMRSQQWQLVANKTCGCKKETDKGCCKTKHQFIKLNDDYKTSVVAYQIEAPSIALSPVEYSFNENVVEKNYTSFNNHSPPLEKGQETYLLNCVFRI